jgi:hypothetical protein
MAFTYIYKAVYLTENNLVCQKNFSAVAEARAFITDFRWGIVLKVGTDRTVADVTNS